jgi:hypothetical protein
MKEKIVSTALEIAGGGVAGYVDGKYADKKVLNQSIGRIIAAGGIAWGFIGKGRIAEYALDLGGGAAAFEFGEWAMGKGMQTPGATRGVRGVGALPRSSHVVTPADLRAAMAHVSSGVRG